ncbi:hypothetical protein AGR4A_pTi0164 [Agrobacterium tumefaciens str. B6]|uniref:Uncharacterized protein n=1 Tax=Agrobacterium tumefaciens str. B6 TaxID=1183423 RepID=A0A822VFJ9_AGRTU|nr:hypothetical protein AGR1C_pTi0147 [Agrobacterium fabacearum TT111]CVI25566.1 hypothetical protein AGR4A_pTi0164 [Agrobacterium tumefaciens str. B6]
MPGWNTAVGYKTGPLAIKAASPSEEKFLDSRRLTRMMHLFGPQKKPRVEIGLSGELEYPF